MKIQKALFVVVMLAASALMSFSQTVMTDYDRNVNFSRYKTYSWTNVEVKNLLWVDRIRNAVDQALAAKGWTQVATGGDVSITAVEITSEHSTVEMNYNGFGNWSGQDYIERQFRVGSLVVNLFDEGTKKLVWRGSASDTLSNKSEKNIEKLNNGVQKMFEHFPPQPKG